MTLPPKLQFLNDNHWLFIFGIILLGLFFFLYGCESTVPSMRLDGIKVNRNELVDEVDFILAQAQTKLEDLDKQDEVRQLILDKAAMFSATGAFNPTGLLNILVSVGAIGTAVDARRKLKVIKQKTPPSIG